MGLIAVIISAHTQDHQCCTVVFPTASKSYYGLLPCTVVPVGANKYAWGSIAIKNVREIVYEEYWKFLLISNFIADKGNCS